MLDTVHVFAGLAIGKHIANPFWAFIFGLISHVILDIIPHWDGGRKGDGEESVCRGLSRDKARILAADVIVCLSLGMILSVTGVLWPGFPNIGSLMVFLGSHWSLITGVAGALLWDILSLLYRYYPSRFTMAISLNNWHKKIQDHKVPPSGISLALQGLLTLVSILLTISR